MNIQDQYRKVSLVALIVGIGIVLFVQLTSFLSGVLGAFTIYLLVRKQLFYLTERRQWKPVWANLLLLGETILFFLIPLSLAAWLLVTKLLQFNFDPARIILAVQHVTDLVQERTGYDLLSKANLLEAASYLPRIGQFLMGSISGLTMNLFMLLLILYFMLSGGRSMEQYVYELLPFSKKSKEAVVKEVDMIVSSNAIGIPLLAVIQGLIAFIGYLIFGVPEPLMFGFLTCIGTVIPFVGTALVWVPLAAYLALTGDWANAVGLALFGVLIVSNIDNLVRFILQKKLADTHPLITIFGVISGLSLFGFMGIIFGPVLIAFFLLCVRIFKEEYLEGSEQKEG